MPLWQKEHGPIDENPIETGIALLPDRDGLFPENHATTSNDALTKRLV